MTISAQAYKWLRGQGFIVDRVETRQGKFASDCFGIFDKVAIGCYGTRDDFEPITWWIQETSGSNHANRRTKIEQSKYGRQLLEWGHDYCVLSFTKRKKKKGGKAMIWVPRCEVARLGANDDFVWDEVERLI